MWVLTIWILDFTKPPCMRTGIGTPRQRFLQYYVVPTQSGFTAIRPVSVTDVRGYEEAHQWTQYRDKLCRSATSRLDLKLCDLPFWVTGYGKYNSTPPSPRRPTLSQYRMRYRPWCVSWCGTVGRLGKEEGGWFRPLKAENFFQLMTEREAGGNPIRGRID